MDYIDYPLRRIHHRHGLDIPKSVATLGISSGGGVKVAAYAQGSNCFIINTVIST